MGMKCVILGGKRVINVKCGYSNVVDVVFDHGEEETSSKKEQ